jgi:gluconolactonase
MRRCKNLALIDECLLGLSICRAPATNMPSQRRIRHCSLTALGAFIGVFAIDGAAQDAYPREALVQTIAGVVEQGEEWQLVWDGTNNADGIVGTADGALLFAQEQPRLVGKIDSAGEYSIELSQTRGVGSLSMDAEGRLLGVERTCTDPGRRSDVPCAEPTAVAIIRPSRQVLADSNDGDSLGRLNDLVADRLGGAYFTVGGAFYVSANGDVSSVADDLRANGIMLSPDERTLYVTNREVVVAFDVATDGRTSNRRDFARLEAGGNGDGMAVDGTGRLYVTSQPGVQVFDVRGRYLGLIPTPRPAISVAFAGLDKRYLYVVGRGASLGPDGTEYSTPEGVRNNAKTIYRIGTVTQGYLGRAK